MVTCRVRTASHERKRMRFEHLRRLDPQKDFVFGTATRRKSVELKEDSVAPKCRTAIAIKIQTSILNAKTKEPEEPLSFVAQSDVISGKLEKDISASTTSIGVLTVVSTGVY